MTNAFLTKVAAAAALIMSFSIVAPGFSHAEVTTLRDSVAATLSYNPNIKAFQEYRQAADDDVKRARSGWFPRVDARAGYGFEQWSDDNTRRRTPQKYKQSRRTFYDRSEASLTVSQTIWDGLATWNRYQQGKQRAESAENRLFDNAEGLGLDSVLAHIEIYRQRRIVSLAELNVQNHRQILGSQSERHRSGASTMADVSQTQTRLARSEATLAESRAALETGIANYKRLTGRIPGQIEVPADPMDAYPSLEAALAQNQVNNPKITALRADAMAAESQTGIDFSAFHPQVYFEAGPTYSYRTGSSLTDQGGMLFMLRANWNLFNGGYDWYNVQGDKARARQARLEVTALLDSLAEETETTWTELLSAQEQARFYTNAVEYATKTRDMYLQQFNVGQRSLLDVLDAENELFSSSIQLVTAQQNIIAAKYRLLTLGGGLLASLGLDRSNLVIDTHAANRGHE